MMIRRQERGVPSPQACQINRQAVFPPSKNGIAIATYDLQFRTQFEHRCHLLSCVSQGRHIDYRNLWKLRQVKDSLGTNYSGVMECPLEVRTGDTPTQPHVFKMPSSFDAMDRHETR
ncbi:hypothetical protein AUP68_15880 [Ilyonectria robusta]